MPAFSARKTVSRSPREPRKASPDARNGHTPLAPITDFFAHPTAGNPSLVIHGDAFDLIDRIPNNSVDLVITSPPYWGLRTYGMEHNWEILDEWKALGNAAEVPPPFEWYRTNGGVLGLEPLPEWYVANIAGIMTKTARPLKPRGSLWLNIGDTYFARWASIRPEGRQGLSKKERFRRKTPMGGFRQEKNLLLIPARVAIAMQDLRWILRNDLIWFKPNVPPTPNEDRLRLAHEHFFHFVKRPKEGRANYYYEMEETEPGDVDVISCNVKAGDSGHSATFPPELIKPRILSSCPPGGVVLDPFCGTGRALAEAVRSGRRALGFDLNRDFMQASETAARNAHQLL